MQIITFKADDIAQGVERLKQAVMSEIKGRDRIEIIVRPDKLQRSRAQNRMYWAILQQIAESAEVEGRRYSKDVWHEYFAGKYLPKRELELPDGTIKIVNMSTTELTTDDMVAYVEQITAEAQTELGIEM